MSRDGIDRQVLYLVRHGHAGKSGPKRYIGWTDLPLSEKGIRQARSLRNRFSSIPVARIISSDLTRAGETARIIAGSRAEEIERFSDFREIHLGQWEGRPFNEIKTEYPEAYAARGRDWSGFRPPGGESFSDLRRRVIPAVERCLGETAGDLLLVAHAGVNRVILCHFLGMPLKHLFRIGQDHGAVNVIRFNNGRPCVALVNAPRG